MTNKLYVSAHLKGDFTVKATTFPPSSECSTFATVELEQPGGDINFFLRDMREAEILRAAFALIQAARQEKQEAA